MKALCTALCATILVTAIPAVAHEEQPKSAKAAPKAAPATAADKSKAPQHSGGTDAYGCHTNHSTGEYHCHKPK